MMIKKTKFAFLRKGGFWFGVVFFISSITSLVPGNQFSDSLFGNRWFGDLVEFLISLGLIIKSVLSSKDSEYR